MITKAFMAYGFKGDFVLVAIEGKLLWRKDVLPTVKKGIELLTGKKVPWSEIYFDGWIPIHNETKTDWIDPIQFFNESHEQKKFNRLIVHGKDNYTLYRKGE